ncbi:MAG TPA: hypothetical protein VLJ60_09055 [bacterium]|nr:hypothetical protein [bacterium]
MKRLSCFIFCVFFSSMMFADTLVTAYKLWLETTEKPEKVKIGLLVQDEYGLLPECEDCEYCAEDQSQEGCEECAEKGCGWPYGYYSYDRVAGEVYRGKFDSSHKLTEVVKIQFDDYFDECVTPGYYEYLQSKDFPYTHCHEAVSNYDDYRPECSNFAGITIPEHSEVCPAQDKVEMTQEEFESMKYPFSDKDLESNDYENDDVENDDENDDSATDDHALKDDVELYDNDTATEQNDEHESTVDNDNEPEISDISNKTEDGCSLLII